MLNSIWRTTREARQCQPKEHEESPYAEKSRRGERVETAGSSKTEIGSSEHMEWTDIGFDLTALRCNSEYIYFRFCKKRMIAGERIALVSLTPVSNVIFCVAGFRPGRRGPFVPAKGPKTIDAPSGLIREDGSQL